MPGHQSNNTTGGRSVAPHSIPATRGIVGRLLAFTTIIVVVAGLLGLAATPWLPARDASSGATPSATSRPGGASQPGVSEPTPSPAASASADRRAAPPPQAVALAGVGGWRGTGRLAAPADGPALSAKAAFAVDLTNQVELFSLNPDEPLPPASTTKIVTALLAVKYGSLDDVVTVDPRDLVDPAIYSHMGLEAGDQVTVRDLLAGLLIPSGGDAANALARYIGTKLGAPAGSDPRARFVQEMNTFGASLGLTHSHFVDPSGEDQPGHVMSARDLAIAAAALFEQQSLTQIVDEGVITVQVQGPNARTLTLYNTNEMLGDPDVHGVKTGTTTNAGQCLVLAIWRGNARIITVVLGSADRYADTQAILSYLDSRFSWVTLGRGGAFPDLLQTLDQQGLTMMTNRTVLLTQAEAADLHYTFQPSQSQPDQNGSPWKPRGKVVFSVGADELLELPVYARTPGVTSQP